MPNCRAQVLPGMDDRASLVFDRAADCLVNKDVAVGVDVEQRVIASRGDVACPGQGRNAFV